MSSTSTIPETFFAEVLLVEDDASHAMLIKRALKGFCQHTRHADSLNAALTELQGPLPTVIISDLNLPDSTELRHIAAIRIKAPNIPLLVLTSSTSLNDAVEAMKLGASDFLVKNFDQSFREVLGLSLARIYSQEALKAERLRLEKEMQALQGAIENSNDAMAVINGDGSLGYYNQALKRFVESCGGSIENARTLLGAQIARADQLTQQLDQQLSTLDTGSAWQVELSFTTNKQLAYTLNLSIAEKAKRAVLWVRDISEIKQREKFQREMLSTTTHDLKGPLGSIMIMSELLQDQLRGQERPYEISLKVGSCARNIVNLIDEFLSARRIEEGTFVLKPHQADLNALLKELVEDFQTIAQARKVTLSVENSASEINGNFDRLGISRALSNLISNALKFTPGGGSVSLDCEQQGDELQVVVQDSGCGIEPAELQTLFERYSRLDKHHSTPGTGLGLYVVRCVITAHGGRIDVTSKPNQGTRFVVSLPLNPPVNERGELIAINFA